MSETDPLYREHRIWRRPAPERSLRYVVFENLATGQFAVQTCDFFPAEAESVAFLEANIGELLADEDLGERGWHATILEAIDAFDAALAEELDDEIEDEDGDEFDEEDDEYKD